MSPLISIQSEKDIPQEYRGTPIELFLQYHNLNAPFKTYTSAELLIGMCMDNRKHLHIPDNFAYIIRAAGANLRYSEFKISFAIGAGGVSHIALIGHTQCGMENLASRKESFVQGLVERAGWEKKQAEEHFLNFCLMFEIGNVTEFILSETKRIRARYPKIQVAPFIYKVEDNLLYAIRQ
jgi:carbonic anhydrase